jgi:hypothetical protein
MLPRRLNDPASEYRRFDVYHDGNRFSFWVAVFFANDSEHFLSSLISVGGESLIRQEVIFEIGQLCHDEEFALVNGADATFFQLPVGHQDY